MNKNSSGEVTALLRAWSAGAPDVSEKLVRLVYKELRKMAGGFLAGERQGHTLQPTALIHEAYLRIVDQKRTDWQDRRHFFAIAARTMRRILVDYARSHHSQKRIGTRERVPLEDANLISPQRPAEVIAVAEALERLMAVDEFKASIVELRYFAGFTVEETAEALGCVPATIYRHWGMAKRWLYREIQGSYRDGG